jgi:hypothetical protein
MIEVAPSCGEGLGALSVRTSKLHHRFTAIAGTRLCPYSSQDYDAVTTPGDKPLSAGASHRTSAAPVVELCAVRL